MKILIFSKKTDHVFARQMDTEINNFYDESELDPNENVKNKQKKFCYSDSKSKQ